MGHGLWLAGLSGDTRVRFALITCDYDDTIDDLIKPRVLGTLSILKSLCGKPLMP